MSRAPWAAAFVAHSWAALAWSLPLPQSLLVAQEKGVELEAWLAPPCPRSLLLMPLASAGCAEDEAAPSVALSMRCPMPPRRPD
eukprot:6087261-Pyramimonas_sp.AAC.1